MLMGLHVGEKAAWDPKHGGGDSGQGAPMTKRRRDKDVIRT